MRVILIRHYQTESNARNRVMGWTDSPPCAGWSDDVEFIVERLREQDVQPEAIYCSDLVRSRETAKAYAKALGVTKVVEKVELREINYGSLQTHTKKWVLKHYPEHKLNPDLVYPHGESFTQMQERGVRCLLSLVQAHSGHSILVVSHAGLIRGIVCHCLELDYASNLKHHVPFRYIGDFQFSQAGCMSYRELGKISGFIEAGVIDKSDSGTPGSGTRTDC